MRGVSCIVGAQCLLQVYLDYSMGEMGPWCPSPPEEQSKLEDAVAIILLKYWKLMTPL